MVQKKKKTPWQQYVGLAFFLLIGAACGFLMVHYLKSASGAERSFGEDTLFLAMLFVGMYVMMFLQIVVHEAGHLVFGLLTGYRYSSFRVGSLMWLKEDGKLRFRRLSLAGTGGQCLMIPPEMRDGKLPFVLYNLGGSLMNVIFALLFLGLYLLCRNIPFLAELLLMGALIGAAFALMNGVPMRTGAVDNDGYNALSLGKNSEALHAFWVQMKVNEQIARGVRLKDMPEEWFIQPTPEGMQNSMAAAIAVFACNRLIDAQEFAEANARMEALVEGDNAIVGLHRSLMICDLIYCELIGENRAERLLELRTKEQLKFMKTMKKFPSVLRTEYAYALLAERDEAKAAAILAQFERIAKTYPYPADIESERELLMLAGEREEVAL